MIYGSTQRLAVCHIIAEAAAHLGAQTNGTPNGMADSLRLAHDWLDSAGINLGVAPITGQWRGRTFTVHITDSNGATWGFAAVTRAPEEDTK